MRILVCTSLLTVWIVAGCAERLLAPEPMPVDRVHCARCGMLISNETGGGEIVSTTAETRFYDDIACLAADASTSGQDTRTFIRLTGESFVEPDAAFFAASDRARTPMGSGLQAFRTAGEARAADRAGRALTWNEVRRRSGE